MDVNFSNLKIDPLKMYGGNNGNKLGIIYQGECYMLKFPPKANLNPAMSYSNGCINEYVACHIFNSIGIETQITVLGRYNDKITVACKDFETSGKLLKNFAQLKNTIRKRMNYIMGNIVEIETRIFKYPTSAIQHEGKKINYFQFLMTTENEDCLQALKTIANKIDMKNIYSIVDTTPYISDLHKEFLKTMIRERKEKIIDPALKRALIS